MNPLSLPSTPNLLFIPLSATCTRDQPPSSHRQPPMAWAQRRAGTKASGARFRRSRSSAAALGTGGRRGPQPWQIPPRRRRPLPPLRGSRLPPVATRCPASSTRSWRLAWTTTRWGGRRLRGRGGGRGLPGGERPAGNRPDEPSGAASPDRLRDWEASPVIPSVPLRRRKLTFAALIKNKIGFCFASEMPRSCSIPLNRREVCIAWLGGRFSSFF